MCPHLAIYAIKVSLFILKTWYFHIIYMWKFLIMWLFTDMKFHMRNSTYDSSPVHFHMLHVSRVNCHTKPVTSDMWHYVTCYEYSCITYTCNSYLTRGDGLTAHDMSFNMTIEWHWSCSRQPFEPIWFLRMRSIWQSQHRCGHFRWDIGGLLKYL